MPHNSSFVKSVVSHYSMIEMEDSSIKICCVYLGKVNNMINDNEALTIDSNFSLDMNYDTKEVKALGQTFDLK